MLIQIPNRNRFTAMLMAISFIPSQGYQIVLNENGFICPVLSEDESMNVIFKSDTMTSFEVETLLKLTIPDMCTFRKFFKGLPLKDSVIEYDEHLNSITHEKTKLSLNGIDVIPGRITSKKPLLSEWYRVEIENVDSLYEMCSLKNMGETVEVNNRKIKLYTWDMKVSVTDANNDEVSDDFKTSFDRNILKTITRIHKKIGLGSMYLKIFKDPSIPLIQILGDGFNYTAYCGKYNEGQSQNGATI